MDFDVTVLTADENSGETFLVSDVADEAAARAATLARFNATSDYELDALHGLHIALVVAR